MDRLVGDRQKREQQPSKITSSAVSDVVNLNTVDALAALNKIIWRNFLHVGLFSFFFNALLFSSPIYMLQIYNRILPAKAEEALINITLLLVFMMVSMGVFDVIRQWLLVRLAREVEHIVSRDALEAALSSSIENGPTSNHRQILCDIDQIRSLLTRGHLLHLFDILWLPGFLLAVALLHPLLALVALIGVGLLGAIGALGHAIVTPAVKKASGSSWRISSIADQMLSKADTLCALGMKPAMLRRWDRMREEVAEEHMAAGYHLALLTSASKAVRVTIQSITLGVGAHLAIHDLISAGAIVAGSVLVGRALGPIEASVLAWHELWKAFEARKRLIRVRGEHQVTKNYDAVRRCVGSLKVAHLSYEIDRRVLLRNINFELEPGQLFVIFGPSGTGKTTLAKHLVGTWSTGGAVRLDGLDVASMSDSARARLIGYLPQDCELFDGTIAETISRFGNTTAKKIIENAELAGVHEMILRLPNDYGTRIGVGGCPLSGGQRQRLAFARALYGDPAMVVLDEPSAHLDESCEHRLIQTLRTIKERGTTICLATHKSNFINIADRILILNSSGEARFGAPRDLLIRRLHPVPAKKMVR